jgi:hypothetical protein
LVCCGKMIGILSDTGWNEISLTNRSSIDLKMLPWWGIYSLSIGIHSLVFTKH